MLLIAGVIGGLLAWFITRDMRKKTGAAQTQMISVYEETIVAKHQLAEELKALHAQQLANIKGLLEVMTVERDEYRNKLHESVNILNSIKLELAELKARPNVDELFKLEKEWHDQREAFYLKISESQERMVESQGAILRIVQQIEGKLETESQQHRKELSEYSTACSKTADAMDALVTRLTNDGTLTQEPQKVVVINPPDDPVNTKEKKP